MTYKRTTYFQVALHGFVSQLTDSDLTASRASGQLPAAGPTDSKLGEIERSSLCEVRHYPATCFT